MKKIIFYILAFVSGYNSLLLAIKPTITKSTSSQYSGLSGRRYSIPQISDGEEVIVITPASKTYQEDLVLADEENRKMRALQLQRSSKRPYGSYKYHSSSSVASQGGL